MHLFTKKNQNVSSFSRIIFNFSGTTDKRCSKNKLTSPILHEWFYEVTILSMAIGTRVLQLPCVQYNNPKTIVDSGSSNLRLPSLVSKNIQPISKQVQIFLMW